MSTIAKRHMDKVARLPCVPCLLIFGKHHPSEHLHHIQDIRDKWSDFIVIPVCQEMHTGPNGIHGLSRRGFARTYGFDDLTMLAKTLELLT